MCVCVLIPHAQLLLCTPAAAEHRIALIDVVLGHLPKWVNLEDGRVIMRYYLTVRGETRGDHMTSQEGIT